MHLQLLERLPGLTIYYDSFNDWLFLDWEGDLALPAVQTACVAVARCYLPRPYARVLNNNAQVTGVHWGVAVWLAKEFLPHLALAGAVHVAWVNSKSLPGRSMVQTVLNWLPGPAITCFGDVEEAVAWLAHIPREPGLGTALPRTSHHQTQLEQVIRALGRKIPNSVLVLQ